MSVCKWREPGKASFTLSRSKKKKEGEREDLLTKLREQEGRKKKVGHIAYRFFRWKRHRRKESLIPEKKTRGVPTCSFLEPC